MDSEEFEYENEGINEDDKKFSDDKPISFKYEDEFEYE